MGDPHPDPHQPFPASLPLPLGGHAKAQLLQTVLWLAYLSADAVAVFVLGHLAVRATEPTHELMSFWAPFVLVHLGGQDKITAFAKQDNDLWSRHLLNLVIQAGVAGYVVAKASWPDARLRAALVIMFVCGWFKYAERVFCLFWVSGEKLKRSSRYSLWWKLLGPGKKEEGEEIREDMNRIDMISRGNSSWPPSELYLVARTTIDDIISVDPPVNKASNITVAAPDDGSILACNLEELSRSHNNAYEYVGAVLECCYRLLYSKDQIRFPLFRADLHTCPRIFISSFFNLLSTVATSIALALFMSVHKRGQPQASNRVDITVTYALLVGALVLDVASVASLIFLYLSFYLRPCLAKSTDDDQSVEARCCVKQCSQELGQYNIIVGPNTVFTLDVLQCKPVNQDHVSIKNFIFDTLLFSGTKKIWCIASTRGRLALSVLPATTTRRLKSLKKEITTSSADFPTSMLILHIATDICYHWEDTYNSSSSDHQVQVVKMWKQTSIELSNYIMYLVFKCGVMLTTDSQIAHDTARHEILKFLLPEVYATMGWRYGFRKMKNELMFNLGSHKDDTWKLMLAIRKQQETEEKQDAQTEIKTEESVDNDVDAIRKQQETEEKQDAQTEIKNEESADNDVDDFKKLQRDSQIHIKKLQMNSQTLKSPVLRRAVAVAKELMSIEEAQRWDLIAKVWAEMLYYTAPRCGGDFHYEHLSKGGEFVTHVLLLMYYLGPFLPQTTG